MVACFSVPQPSSAMFLGEYLHTFDSKNRISLPSRFRKDLGRVVVITRGLDHCLYVYSRRAWEKEAQKYASDANGSAARRGLARLFLAGSSLADVDRTGRVLHPEHFKAFCSIKEKAIIPRGAGRGENGGGGGWLWRGPAGGWARGVS